MTSGQAARAASSHVWGKRVSAALVAMREGIRQAAVQGASARAADGAATEMACHVGGAVRPVARSMMCPTLPAASSRVPRGADVARVRWVLRGWLPCRGPMRCSTGLTRKRGGAALRGGCLPI